MVPHLPTQSLESKCGTLRALPSVSNSLPKVMHACSPAHCTTCGSKPTSVIGYDRSTICMMQSRCWSIMGRSGSRPWRTAYESFRWRTAYESFSASPSCVGEYRGSHRREFSLYQLASIGLASGRTRSPSPYPVKPVEQVQRTQATAATDSKHSSLLKRILHLHARNYNLYPP